MKDLNARLTALSPHQRTLLEVWLKNKQAVHVPQGLPEIPKRVRRHSCVLSFPQQRLWFLEQLEPGCARYNISHALRLSGSLNEQALQKALDALVLRHEVLRTTFADVEGVPRQRLAEQANAPITTYDLSSVPAQARETELQQRLFESAQKPFNLSVDCMLRATLLRTDPQEQILLLTMHHIASDAWSMGLLFDELREYYAAFTNGTVPQLRPLPIQYADYAEWQHRGMDDATLRRQFSYWKHQLAGPIPRLELPIAQPAPAVRSYRGARHGMQLSTELTRSLKSLCQRKRVTEYMLLLAALKTLLLRYTGQEDLIIGSPIAGRNRVEVEGLIGFFINTLVMRTNLSGDPSFNELLNRVRETALSAYANQDIPFEKLVEELHPERRLGRNPFFQIMFVLQNAPAVALSLPNLKIEPLRMHDGSAKFDLTLLAVENGGAFRFWFEYDTELFDARSIERMAGHFQTLLEALVEQSDLPLSQLPLLTGAEHERIVRGFNQTRQPYPQEKSIAELFEEQVDRSPQSIAVSYDPLQLSYAELNARANQLAHYLRRCGVGPDCLVGVCVVRSIEMVIGILGILKAGGAYVPLDTSYPRERLAFMISDTQAPVLITRSSMLAALPEYSGRIVNLDADNAAIAAESDANPARNTCGENLAYVIYTSGSTGVPKGICIPQKAVSRLVFNTNYVQFTPGDRIAQVSNASFDAATFEFWGALLHGGRLVGITKDIALSPHAFAAELRKQKISAMFLTTALFNLVVREIPNAFATVKHLLIGGEAVDAESTRIALKSGAPGRLLNVYGPTEVTTFATWHHINQVEAGAKTVSIGRPISNTEAYILDRQLNPVPIGIPGEIYLGGDGLARGYFNRPELTAQKFVPHPFSSTPGARLYRTGDLARFAENGDIEFIGRIDHQVKLRGFRIELGEIESAICRIKGVREAVVVVSGTGADKRLVAYVAGREGLPAVDGLRASLKETLPDYMLPSAFVMLGALPLTPNGKVDRAALPSPASQQPESRPVIAPSTGLQARLAEIWQELLSVKRVGTRDNFFELGGHSLLAVQMMARVEKLTGRKVPLSVLFDGATIEDLERALQKVERDSQPYVAFNERGSRAPFFFLHGDLLGGGLYCANLARKLGPDQPLYALHPHALNTRSAVPDIETLARDYVRLIRSICPEGPYMLGGFCLGGCLAYEVARQLREIGYEITLLFVVDYAPCDPAVRAIRSLSETMGSRMGLDTAGMINLSNIWLDRLRRFRSFCRLPVREKIASGMKNIVRRIRNCTALKVMRAAPKETLSIDPALSDSIRAYQWTIAGYMPQPSPTLVTLALSGEHDDIAPTWKGVTEIEILSIPGSHLDCITRSLDVLAAGLNQNLAKSRLRTAAVEQEHA